MPAGRQGRRRTIDSNLLITALAQSQTMEQAAQLAGCSAPAIQARAKQDPQVKQAIQDQIEQRTESLAEAISAEKGILSKVAARVGLGSAAAVRHHIARSPRLAAVFSEARERVVDVAEENVFHAVEEGNLAYSWKVLQTLGKDRGYTERREVEQQHIHSVEQASTSRLIEALSQENIVEADFHELSPTDKTLVMEALHEAVQPSARQESKVLEEDLSYE